MNNKINFSIIIPAYNRAKELNRALESIDKQTFRNFEVIVCDDGSTDNTKQIVETFYSKFSISYLWQEHWGGPGRPRNNGIKVAKGDFIAFLDSDDWWYPKKLEAVKNFTHNSDVIYHDLDIYTESGKKFFKKIRGRHLREPIFIDLMINENALINSSVVARKEIIDRAGGLVEDKDLISVEDFDLWLKISRITERFKYIPNSLGAYFIASNCVSQIPEFRIKKIENVYHKHLVNLSNDNKKQTQFLMSYLLGRLKQKMRRFEDALELFKISSKSKNFKIKIRSLIWILILIILTKLKNKF